MGDKKGYLIAGLLGAVAGIASLIGLVKLKPKLAEKCCEGLGDDCCGKHKAVKKTAKKKRSD